MNKKDINYYMGLPYKIEIVPEESEAGFNATVRDLKGCMAFGETITEAVEALAEIKQAWFELALERGWQIPEPAVIEYPEYSGKFNVRLPRYLHRELAEMAKQEDTSLNQLVVALLSEGSERRQQEHRTLAYADRVGLDARALVQLQSPPTYEGYSLLTGEVDKRTRAAVRRSSDRVSEYTMVDRKGGRA